MTLDKARALLTTQIIYGGGYNRHAVRIILVEIIREHGQSAVDNLINEFSLDEKFGIKAGVTIKL